MDQAEQDFNNDNQNYYGEDTHEQNSFRCKKINDYIENHYHDSNSDDIDMDGNNIGESRNAEKVIGF